MAEVGALRDKQTFYYGSTKQNYAEGVIISGTAWADINPSGAFGLFGTASNEYSNRCTFVNNGSSTGDLTWSYNAGSTLHGRLLPGESFSQDGIRVSGLSIRTNTGSINYRIWMW